MCGRYAATSRPEDLVEDFDIEQVMTGEPSRSLLSAPQDPPPGAPDYNVAPTKQAPVVLTRAPRSSDASYDEGRLLCASCACSRGDWCRAGPRTSRSG